MHKVSFGRPGIQQTRPSLVSNSEDNGKVHNTFVSRDMTRQLRVWTLTSLSTLNALLQRECELH